MLNILLMGENMRKNRIVNLLETYENRDFSFERAKHWEESPLDINDELMA